MTFQVFHKTGLLFFQIGFHKWPEYELFHRYDFSEFRFSPILFHAVSRSNAHACSHYRYRTPSDMGFPRMLLRSMYGNHSFHIQLILNCLSFPLLRYRCAFMVGIYIPEYGPPYSVDISRDDVFQYRFSHFCHPNRFSVKGFLPPSRFLAFRWNRTHPSGHTISFSYSSVPPIFLRSPPLRTASMMG